MAAGGSPVVGQGEHSGKGGAWTDGGAAVTGRSVVPGDREAPPTHLPLAQPLFELQDLPLHPEGQSEGDKKPLANERQRQAALSQSERRAAINQ